MGVRGAAVFGIRGAVDVHVLVEDVKALCGLSGLSLKGGKVGGGGFPVDVPVRAEAGSFGAVGGRFIISADRGVSAAKERRGWACREQDVVVGAALALPEARGGDPAEVVRELVGRGGVEGVQGGGSVGVLVQAGAEGVRREGGRLLCLRGSMNQGWVM